MMKLSQGGGTAGTTSRRIGAAAGCAGAPHQFGYRSDGPVDAASVSHGAEIADLGLRWLELDRKARLILTRQLRVVWQNRAVDLILESSSQIERRDGMLIGHDAGSHERLATLVETCGEAMATLLLRSVDSQSHLLARAQRLALPDCELVGLTLAMTEAGSLENGCAGSGYPGVEAAFGLTPAERRVLMALIDGKTADETAAAYSVSLDTVRSQIRGIYEKMDVSSREGLFARIRPFAG
jgi:DNA-binding CsgD family transcriptional regulator